MRRVRHCHKVCSLFGTVSALHLNRPSGTEKGAIRAGNVDLLCIAVSP